MKNKICFECKKEKLISYFGKDKKSKDGLRTRCKECNNKRATEYYQRNGISGSRKNVAQRNRKFIYDFLQKSKCIDCGDERWQVLEFDHVRGKKRCNISSMINSTWSIAAIAMEINKCDIRCANCHRIKTAKQLDFYKSNWDKFSNITYPSKKYTTTHIGEVHLSAKLTEKEVINIRKEYIPKIITHAKLAKKYGVSESVIFSILHGKTWKHLL